MTESCREGSGHVHIVSSDVAWLRHRWKCVGCASGRFRGVSEVSIETPFWLALFLKFIDKQQWLTTVLGDLFVAKIFSSLEPCPKIIYANLLFTNIYTRILHLIRSVQNEFNVKNYAKLGKQKILLIPVASSWCVLAMVSYFITCYQVWNSTVSLIVPCKQCSRVNKLTEKGEVFDWMWVWSYKTFLTPFSETSFKKNSRSTTACL